MKQNIIDIAVTAVAEDATDTLQAGKMYEHNATALRFVLEEALISSEYRYYVEFVTVRGVARTAYVTPDSNRQITVELPVEITSQMTALCVLNIVKIAENGKTEQVIKAKTVRLYFSALENTDRLLDENHAFSVNQLLEAIRQNTFKGEKGEKGDAYVLTPSDKTEIAEKTSQSFYGLPLFYTASGTESFLLHGVGDSPNVSEVCIYPAENAEAVSEVKLTVGENAAASILDSALYNTFERDQSTNYVLLPLHLKPNTVYTFTKLNAEQPALLFSMLLLENKQQICFCHSQVASENRKQISFETGATGLVYLRTTGIMQSQSRYQQVLSNEWAGLTVTETAASSVCRAVFEKPLYRIGKACADSFDVLKGIVTRRVAEAAFSETDLDTGSVQILQNGGRTVYRYKLCLPTGAAAKKPTDRAGRCSHTHTLEEPLAENAVLPTADENGLVGVFFGAAYAYIFVYTEMNAESFSAFLAAQAAAETPFTVYYSRENPITETVPNVQLPVWYENPIHVHIAPDTAAVSIRYAAGVSDVIANFESRIKSLENII